MAALIPLFLPQIIDAGVNIGIGISNAIQGDSSSVSFQVGKKVFTTKKKFNFGSLPMELRERIILMAMEESKSLILPTPYLFDPLHPPTPEQIKGIQQHHPLHPESKHYRSIVGDRISANGYPISTWRWARISTEWRDVVRKPLWKDLEVLGYQPYKSLIKRMKGDFDALKYVRSITLREGFREPEDIYHILLDSRLTSLESISFLPDYPTPFHQLVPAVSAFNFGLQLIRTQKPIKSLTYGFPLETTTNPSSRQHLRTLHPPRLTLTFGRPTVALFDELRDMEGTTDLGIRYVGLRNLVSHDVFLCEALQTFPRVHLYLHLPRPRMILTGPPDDQSLAEDPASPSNHFVTSLLSALESAGEEVQKRYTVRKIVGWDTAGQVANATRTRLWPSAVLFDLDDPEPDEDVRPSTPPPTDDNWERETNLKILGGLINLSLESKRHRARDS